MSYKIYGINDMSNAPTESAEQATFFNLLRVKYPHIHSVAVHIPNEGKRTPQQMSAIKTRGGYVKGASDIFIPGAPSLLIELKSRDKKSKISPSQIEYLNNAHSLGAYCCLCYGYESAMNALEDWISMSESAKNVLTQPH